MRLPRGYRCRPARGCACKAVQQLPVRSAPGSYSPRYHRREQDVVSPGGRITVRSRGPRCERRERQQQQQAADLSEAPSVSAESVCRMRRREWTSGCTLSCSPRNMHQLFRLFAIALFLVSLIPPLSDRRGSIGIRARRSAWRRSTPRLALKSREHPWVLPAQPIDDEGFHLIAGAPVSRDALRRVTFQIERELQAGACATSMPTSRSWSVRMRAGKFKMPSAWKRRHRRPTWTSSAHDRVGALAPRERSA